ncbi:hypothetical protein [Odoribacter laneus]|uniref:hypothetical protein n=1 Tax=Odoribacter laneus TaxID=626933 RepID=UPI003AF8F7A6
MENTGNKKIIVCVKCGKELNNGFYNSPNGIFCPECWENKPKEEREQLYNDAIENIAAIVELKKKNDREHLQSFVIRK